MNPSTRRRSVALVIVALLSAALLVFVTQVAPAPAAAPAPVLAAPPVCALRGRLPAPFFRLLVQLFRATCPSPATTTSTTTTIITTTTVPGTYVGLYGTVGLATCGGTPTAPVDCGPVVPATGFVQVGTERVAIGPDGTYHAPSAVGPVPVWVTIPAPPGRVIDCPMGFATGSAEGPTRSTFDAVCRSFPKPPPITIPTTIIGDFFGIQGTLMLVTCEGTPAAPVNCGEPVPTAGQVRLGDRVLDTSEWGSYRIDSPVGYVPVQGIVAAPTGRIVDCPVVYQSGSGGGPRNNRYDPICRSFPAPHDH